VEVIDRGDKPGGSLCELGEGELPAKVLAADVDFIRRAGVTFTRAALGEKLSLGELRERFDAVVLAMGASAELGVLGELSQADGKLAVQRGTGATNLPGVFEAGALAGRGGRAIAAVADGQIVAGAVEQFLAGLAVTGRPRLANVRYGPLEEDEQALLWSRATNAGPSVGEVKSDRDALAEANRCLICGCPDNTLCRLRGVAGEVGATMTRFVGERRRFARDASHPDVVYEPHKCILCGACVRIAQAAGEQPGLTYVGRGFAGRVSPPYEGRWVDALGSSAAKCAQACPTSAIRPQKRFE
jgi:formate dehydrogenase major subunit